MQTKFFRFFIMVLIVVMMLTGCNTFRWDTKGSANISWVDFVQIDDKHYIGEFNIVMTDSVDIGAQIGMIKYSVSQNVSNPFKNSSL